VHSVAMACRIVRRMASVQALDTPSRQEKEKGAFRRAFRSEAV
jgi:hypothetical protein